MARDYIPKEWTHGRPAWNRAKALLQDYDRLVRERQNILHSSPRPSDGQPRGTEPGKPTEDKAMRLARINDDLEAVDQAAIETRGRMSHKVREDFNPMRAFWSYNYYNYQHVRQGDNDYGPSVRTWNRYKLAFVALVAQRAKII